ncbi:MAG: DUF4345 family protein [Yoonia sp.]|nr:DUF4345 family protein [Yoonia sp.]
MDTLNIIFALLSIGLGAFGWLAPKYTMETLNLTGHTDTMGMSEISASAGALFVGMGMGALILGTPAAFAMIGFCWMGAAMGRLTSVFRDGATPKKWGFFAVEAAVGLSAIAYNL